MTPDSCLPLSVKVTMRVLPLGTMMFLLLLCASTECSKMEMNSPGPRQSKAVWVRTQADYFPCILLFFLLCSLLLLSRLLFYFISSNFVLDILKDGFLLYPNKTGRDFKIL